MTVVAAAGLTSAEALETSGRCWLHPAVKAADRNRRQQSDHSFRRDFMLPLIVAGYERALERVPAGKALNRRSSFDPYWLRHGQLNDKARTHREVLFHADGAAMVFDDAAYDRQT